MALSNSRPHERYGTRSIKKDQTGNSFVYTVKRKSAWDRMFKSKNTNCRGCYDARRRVAPTQDNRVPKLAA
ncbi:hypothetical protein DITRI_Ditri01bG0137500 [Diplodiscus trichospermus]